MQHRRSNFAPRRKLPLKRIVVAAAAEPKAEEGTAAYDRRAGHAASVLPSRARGQPEECHEARSLAEPSLQSWHGTATIRRAGLCPPISASRAQSCLAWTKIGGRHFGSAAAAAAAGNAERRPPMFRPVGATPRDRARHPADERETLLAAQKVLPLDSLSKNRPR